MNLFIDPNSEPFELYQKTVTELKATALARSDWFKSCQMRIKWQQGEGLSIQIHEPDADAFRSYVMVLRQFVADREPTHFGRISNLIIRGDYSRPLKEVTKIVRSSFLRAFDVPAFPVTINTTPVTARLARNLFFNSQYFHRDKAKMANLDALKGGPAEPIIRYLFLTNCINLFIPIVNFDAILRNRTDESFLASLAHALISSQAS